MGSMAGSIGAGATLQNVLDGIEAAADLKPRERREMSSAIYSFAGKLNRQPHEIPAQLDIVERLGTELNAVRLGITSGRLRNMRSLVRKAIRSTGHTAVMARLDFQLQQPWRDLVELFQDRRTRIALARLFRLFHVLHIAPGEVSLSAFSAVLEYLRSSGAARPDANYRELILAWNRMNILLRSYRT